MKIENRLIADLKPAEYNPRQISTKQYKDLKESIKKFSLVDPIIINKNGNVVIGGHQRLKICKELKHIDIDCVVLDLSKEDERELNIRLNKSGGEWDFDILANQFDIEELKDWGFKEIELGLNIDKIDFEGNTEDDHVPEVKESRVKLGDVWELGKHRLMCGDSTKESDVNKLMNGQKADMVFTDPPYNVGYNYNTYDDKKSEAEYVEFLKNSIPIIEKTIIHNGNSKIYDMVLAFGKPKAISIWTKTNAMSSGSTTSFSVWEPVFFYGQFKRKKGNDLYDYPITKQQGVGNHTCPKPLKLCIELISEYSEKEELIYDPFLGSGSTLIACEKTNRTCYGMELDTKYCDVIIERWEQFTGQKAVKCG